MTIRQAARRHLPALIWALVVAALLAAPGDDLPDAGLWDWLDKPAHALLFGVLCALLARSLSRRRPGGGDLVVAGLVAGLYGVLLEVVQLWVPGRGFDGWDVVADLVGIAVVALLLARRRARLRASC